ncbi:uncharacterized protein FMAN_02061 [Fusarium mangiferae]|uniref:Oxidoreductase n=1 Tax=Fusarium mangiferae TaxID=192010 RepID=A0A1L7SL50_FUSMA|nr:uncharacterized protein FMAN_02061 [Fusarium mangiferae]CVK85153.1 uncharacterized protein FMAN_02061 [Fusarium mangiferae]
MASTTPKPLTVLVIGVGQMGSSHLLAYHQSPHFHVVGVLTRNVPELPVELKEYKSLHFIDLESALALKPDIVAINTHTDSHAHYAMAAMEAGAHVFVEKPLASTLAEAQRVVDAAKRVHKKLVVGYILRHHPSWAEFIKQARLLGPPYVIRISLNQKSRGKLWDIHQRVLKDNSPIVDSGVHYVDVMLQITKSRPVQVRGMGVRLAHDLGQDEVNYGHLQITFADGSVGWYEASLGPMISKIGCTIRDVMGPKGSVSMIQDDQPGSAAMEKVTRSASIRVASVDGGEKDLSMLNEPSFAELCARQQAFLLNAIRGDWDLSQHMDDAVQSLAVAIAAETSRKENNAVDL